MTDLAPIPAPRGAALAAPLSATGARLEPLTRGVPEGTRLLVGAWLLSLPSDPTREVYARQLTAFWRWLEGESPGADPLAITRPAVDAYRAELVAARPVSSAAVAVSAVRSFYRYAASVEAVRRDPAAEVRPPKVPPIGLTPGISVADLGKLLRAAQAAGHRDHALVLLLSSTGVRVSEAIGLDAEHVIDHADPTDGRTYRKALVTRKGSKRDWLAIPAETDAAITSALAGRTAGPVFLAARGARMTRQGAWRALGRLAAAAGVGPVHPHMFRVASITTALAQPGAQLHRVQDMAGHADPRTTRRYDREASSVRLSPSHALASLLVAAEREATKAGGAR